MPPRKKSRADPVASTSSGEASTSAGRDSTPQIIRRAEQPEEALGAANGYGMEDEEMGWASLGKPSWKGKGLSDEIKTVEVGSSASKLTDSSLPPSRLLLPSHKLTTPSLHRFLQDKWLLLPAFLKVKGLVKQHLESFDHGELSGSFLGSTKGRS